MFYRFLAKAVLGLTLAGALAAGAAAHHGWSWADTEQIQLTGIVKKVQIAPPHPWLDVETAQAGVWRVELGNPTQTERSGFGAASAQLGERIIVTGNRARDHAEKRMKAVQITVGGKTYDIYPERIQKR